MAYGGEKVTSRNEAMLRLGIATVIAVVIVVYAFYDKLEGMFFWGALGFAGLMWIWIVGAELLNVSQQATFGSVMDVPSNIATAFRSDADSRTAHSNQLSRGGFY